VLSQSTAAAADALQGQLAGLRSDLSALAAERGADAAAAGAALAAAERRLQRRLDACGEGVGALAARLGETERALVEAAEAVVVDQLKLEAAELRGGMESLHATAQGALAAGDGLSLGKQQMLPLPARCRIQPHRGADARPGAAPQACTPHPRPRPARSSATRSRSTRWAPAAARRRSRSRRCAASSSCPKRGSRRQAPCRWRRAWRRWRRRCWRPPRRLRPRRAPTRCRQWPAGWTTFRSRCRRGQGAPGAAARLQPPRKAVLRPMPGRSRAPKGMRHAADTKPAFVGAPLPSRRRRR
jgi:hypothetical protein